MGLTEDVKYHIEQALEDREEVALSRHKQKNYLEGGYMILSHVLSSDVFGQSSFMRLYDDMLHVKSKMYHIVEGQGECLRILP